MMIASSAGGDLLDYRNEILFTQTVTRYADAWHHHEPAVYYFTHVIPAFWLPLIALVPWLWPRWRTAVRERDTLVVVLLAWVVIVLLFFSFSSGKRGVYVLPAVPALAMAAAPWLPELLRARGPRRLAFVLATARRFGAVAAVPCGGRCGRARSWKLGCRPCCRWRSSRWRAPSRNLCCCESGMVGSPTRRRSLSCSSRPASWSFLADRCGPVRRALIERVEEAGAGIAELGLVGLARSSSCCTCGGPPRQFRACALAGAMRPKPRTQQHGLRRAGRALLIDRGACVKLFFARRGRDRPGRATASYHWFLVTGLRGSRLRRAR
jgi:hypothetical protein